MAFDYASLLYGPLYAGFGVALSFRSPRDGQVVSLLAIEATLRHDSGNFRLNVASRRPQYCVRLTDLAALKLAPTDLDGLAVTVDGAQWTVDSSAPIPGPSLAGGEIALNLTAPKP